MILYSLCLGSDMTKIISVFESVANRSNNPVYLYDLKKYLQVNKADCCVFKIINFYTGKNTINKSVIINYLFMYL